ncbi:MAG: hypothetical protein ISN28_06025 [Ectothiorhodospiraceae bacterium AqS1]|nr:hypothetical protein [Ectothiorhodospiraceae bacterium AqS1]
MMPDFAGVALVDILANGVAMLIIVIVLSIATRMEREQRHAEQAEEVGTVMSHRFSTSLVLNSLAASPPAQLHDYENSPLDQAWGDPEVLPVLELHRGFVREPYSGAVWPRRLLLSERNPMHAWLSAFSEDRKRRLRIDIYDIDQFYVVMAILRDYGIVGRHWHFVPGNVSLAGAFRCPPGVPSRDCPHSPAENEPVELPDLARASGSGGEGEGEGEGEDEGDGWPGDGDFGSEAGSEEGAGLAPGPMPSGVVPGASAAGSMGGQSAGNAGDPNQGQAGGQSGGGGQGQRRGPQGRGFGAEPGSMGDSSTLGSFPDIRTGRRGGGGSGSGSGQEQSVRFRIALPETLRQPDPLGGGSESERLEMEKVIGVILRYLGHLQDTLDTGGSPSNRIRRFADEFPQTIANPPPLTVDERRIAQRLAQDISFMQLLNGLSYRHRPLAVELMDAQAADDAMLVIEPNRPIERLGMNPGVGAVIDDPGTDGRRGDSGSSSKRGQPVARSEINLNAYPGIWKGNAIPIEPYSILMMPPALASSPASASSSPAAEEGFRWRAVAYVGPALDDFVFGFVFARLDEEGRLRIQADSNRIRINGESWFTHYREAAFGARGWLVALYAALAAGLLLLVIGRRRWTGRWA